MVYQVTQECRNGFWHIVTYSDDGTTRTEISDIATTQPCGKAEGGGDGPGPGQTPKPPPKIELPPPPEVTCKPVATPPISRQFKIPKDSHQPSGFWAKLAQGVDLLSNEPAGYAGCDWGYSGSASCQSTDTTFHCEVSGFGFVYHLLGNSEDPNLSVTYDAKISCSHENGTCSISYDDAGSITRKTGQCLTLDLGTPTWTPSSSGDAITLTIQVNVSLDAGQGTTVTSPSGGIAYAPVPGANPGITLKLGTYKWKCQKSVDDSE